jgi:hypothetical protein
VVHGLEIAVDGMDRQDAGLRPADQVSVGSDHSLVRVVEHCFLLSRGFVVGSESSQVSAENEGPDWKRWNR